MNSAEFTFLLKNPEIIDATKTQQLEEISAVFPYFQSIRAIQLKGFNKINSFKYNQALKKTAAYTIDRKVLFNFITSSSFNNNRTNKNVEILEEIEVIEPETIETLHKKISETSSKKELIKEQESENEEKESANTFLEIGKPIHFISSEPHSFNEWMQLISQKPIIRNKNSIVSNKKSTNSDDKFSLIDKFIESNPKIKPADKTDSNFDISNESSNENESLMTETLAKVYLEQKKYDSAIKAYHILSLKYPEKSSFFADRIKAIKILQKNKS
ncbi:hypothetical protein [Lutibacter sp. B1]|uniref:hypothetical protein n=1 Tax=Lutibacter sp. B1 TaxID=2725996 RepID=UPI00145681B2|nr:hypothetical protein [Lutibacter sp. B1]NLP57991.1 hypothetical protein [Lutibacter sp. B1]